MLGQPLPSPTPSDTPVPEDRCNGWIMWIMLVAKGTYLSQVIWPAGATKSVKPQDIMQLVPTQYVNGAICGELAWAAIHDFHTT